jgi:hypothetical protein
VSAPDILPNPEDGDFILNAIRKRNQFAVDAFRTAYVSVGKDTAERARRNAAIDRLIEAFTPSWKHRELGRKLWYRPTQNLRRYLKNRKRKLSTAEVETLWSELGLPPKELAGSVGRLLVRLDKAVLEQHIRELHKKAPPRARSLSFRPDIAIPPSEREGFLREVRHISMSGRLLAMRQNPRHSELLCEIEENRAMIARQEKTEYFKGVKNPKPAREPSEPVRNITRNTITPDDDKIIVAIARDLARKYSEHPSCQGDMEDLIEDLVHEGYLRILAKRQLPPPEHPDRKRAIRAIMKQFDEWNGYCREESDFAKRQFAPPVAGEKRMARPSARAKDGEDGSAGSDFEIAAAPADVEIHALQSALRLRLPLKDLDPNPKSA